MDMARRRLTKEQVALSKSVERDILLMSDPNNIFDWTGYIKGPPDSPFSDGWFKLKFDVTQNYPQTPPKVKFLTRVFHPNVHFETGEICLEVLKADSWNAMWTLESVARAIVNLLLNPNADSPLNCDAGNTIRAGDMLAFKSMAKMYTVEEAMQQSKIEASKILNEMN